MLRLVIFILVLLGSLQQCFATTEGCVIGNTLYPNKLGTYNGYDAYATSGKITTDLTDCPRATILSSGGGICVVLMSFWFPSIGTERYYTMMEACPIDDYVPLMLTVIATFGLYVLKCKNIKISAAD